MANNVLERQLRNLRLTTVLTHGYPTEYAKKLLARGDNVNQKEKTTQMTALHRAAFAGRHDVFKLLLNHGARVNSRDYKNRTPLHVLVERNSKPELLKALLNHGANINARNEHGWTPLMIAVRHGHSGYVRNLLNKGANINARGNSGVQAIDFAIQAGNPKVIELLIGKGAKVSPEKLKRWAVNHWRGTPNNAKRNMVARALGANRAKRTISRAVTRMVYAPVFTPGRLSVVGRGSRQGRNNYYSIIPRHHSTSHPY